MSNDTFNEIGLKELAIRIAGDIMLSANPGKAMRKWRELFRISQVELAKNMGISASVISDYESGRRKYPGYRFVKKFVNSLINTDKKKGGYATTGLYRIFLASDNLREAVIDMREFSDPLKIRELCDILDAELIVGNSLKDAYIFGYTIVDSIKLVLDVPSFDYIKLYGTTTQRAAIFTNVKRGRSPLIAIKAMQAGMGGLKPALVILHGPKEIDELAIMIAKKEGLPLAISRIESIEELVKRLSKLE
ncbi:MAG TPA: helix-turn-helix domain-containing protein [Thermofilum sp.]|nr:helix-turn-helix domain-containing protein [Thermofilum sp.]